MEIKKLSVEHYDELLVVLNTTFSHKRGFKVDFERELPKMWVRDDKQTNTQPTSNCFISFSVNGLPSFLECIIASLKRYTLFPEGSVKRPSDITSPKRSIWRITTFF